MEWLESRAVRPRQARYQAALRPDMNCFIHSKALPNFTPNPSHLLPHCAKLCQILLLNRSCARFQRHLVGLTVHFLQGLSLHLQFHLRILFEDLCVALSKELCNPLVDDTACTEPRRIGGAQVIDPEVGNSCAFQCLPPCSLEILMVTGRIFVPWEQEGADPRDQRLALEGFERQRRQGNFSDTVWSLGVGYPDGGIHKVHLVLPHRGELLVHPESRFRDDLNDIPKMWRSL